MMTYSQRPKLTSIQQPTLALAQHQQLTELVRSERKITEAVLKAILEMDISKGYLELGYSSLFDYLTKAHKYSESAAQRRISAARLTKELPEIKPQIQSGEINLTQLSKLAIAVKQEERATGTKVIASQKKEILAKIINKTGFETERVLSQELHYSQTITEKVIPRDEDVMLTLKLTKTQYEKLQKAKSYLSHAKHDANFAEIIEALCDKLIQKKEGKTQSQKKDKPSTQTETKAPERPNNMVLDVTAATAVTSERVKIPVHVQREVFERAHHCCEYESVITGIRCQTRYQLQVDHRVPLAKGGSNEIENLRALCRSHNLSEAKRWGIDILSKYLQ